MTLRRHPIRRMQVRAASVVAASVAGRRPQLRFAIPSGGLSEARHRAAADHSAVEDRLYSALRSLPPRLLLPAHPPARAGASRGTRIRPGSARYCPRSPSPALAGSRARPGARLPRPAGLARPIRRALPRAGRPRGAALQRTRLRDRLAGPPRGHAALSREGAGLPDHERAASDDSRAARPPSRSAHGSANARPPATHGARALRARASGGSHPGPTGLVALLRSFRF